MDYNLNFAQCIREAHSIGGSTFYNICSGTNHYVPWGSLDWISFSFAAIAFTLVCLVILTIASAFIYEATH